MTQAISTTPGLAWCCRHKEYVDSSLFWKDKNRRNGLQKACKECCRVNVKKTHEKLGSKLVTVTSKYCSVCFETKDSDSFHRSKNERDGLCAACKLCVSIYDRARRSDPEQKQKKAKSLKAWQRLNKERMAVLRQVWAARNRAMVKSLTKVRRSKSVSRNEWESILDLFGGRCAYCQNTGSMSMDHFRPLSKGGTHSRDNIVPACKSCNSSKGNRMIFDWVPHFYGSSGRLCRRAS